MRLQQGRLAVWHGPRTKFHVCQPTIFFKPHWVWPLVVVLVLVNRGWGVMNRAVLQCCTPPLSRHPPLHSCCSLVCIPAVFPLQSFDTPLHSRYSLLHYRYTPFPLHCLPAAVYCIADSSDLHSCDGAPGRRGGLPPAPRPRDSLFRPDHFCLPPPPPQHRCSVTATTCPPTAFHSNRFGNHFGNPLRPPFCLGLRLKGLHPTARFHCVALWFHNSVPASQGLDDAVGRMHAMLDLETDEHKIPASRIVFGGFSQGGSVALYGGYKYHAELAGILGLSTWLPRIQEWPEDTTAAAQATPFFMCHGEDDDVVQFKYGERSFEALQGSGRTGEFTPFPRLGHSLNMDELRAVAAWLQQRLPE